MLPLVLQSPTDVARTVAGRARARRLLLGLTQRGLAERAGVSLSSLRRFERTGEIAFLALVRVAVALDAVEGLDGLFPEAPATLDDLVRAPRRRRGWKT